MRFKEFVVSSEAAGPHYMVAGHPVDHSLSPYMHTIALDHHKLAARYYAVDLLSDDINSFIAWMNRDTFLGANITIPYKREFMQVVDFLDETAEAAGALNTIVKEEGSIYGYNTDVSGFSRPLNPYKDLLEGGSVILFGSGGASRAVVYALKQAGAEQIILVSRNPGTVKFSEGVLCNYHNWQAYADESCMLVNATPLGMYPNTGGSPVEDRDSHLLEGKVCYDLVYNPFKTKFLEQAQEAGGKAISGLEMFIGQGDMAFQLWTGKKFPEQKIRRALEDILA